MLSPAQVGGPVGDRRKSRVRGAHFGDFLRHRVPTRGWSSGEKGRHVTRLWSRGHGYGHPCPRYLVSDIPFRWERGGWFTEIRRGPGEGSGTLSQDCWAHRFLPQNLRGPPG